ncbi:hypothetical protein [Bosea sp. (in: a-proteobacteria)]|uniref:hypothetical protein n=1 Tax=Bosea sp. (in: a-proteobacteria) TaxID=1871050 RepID=UPI003561D1A6
MKRFAWMLARWPRPKRERLPATIRPERETPAPAFFAAASACAMKGRARCAPDERVRPGRMRNSVSSVTADTPHIAPSAGDHEEIGVAARCARTSHLAKMRHNSLKQHDRHKPHLAAFYPAIVRLCLRCSLPTPSNLRWGSPYCD